MALATTRWIFKPFPGMFGLIMLLCSFELVVVSSPVLADIPGADTGPEGKTGEKIQDIAEEKAHNPDPWEPLNRKIFAFNDFADTWLLLPIAKGYQWVTPDPLEQGVNNFFGNIFEIRNIANGLLQFKLVQAASDTGRFVVNSTVGLAGFFDVASRIGLEKHEEDFGQTLGYWGVGAGPYMVVPIFGSHTLRDGTGAILDNYSTDPIARIDHVPTRNTVWLFNKVTVRADLIQAEQLITGDRYTFIRDAYLQRREYLVNDGVVSDSFGDDDWGDDDGWDDEWDEE